MEMKPIELPEEVEVEQVEKKPRHQLDISPAMHQKAEDVIQAGIKIEQDSAQLYEAMGAYLNSIHYTNGAKFFKTHAQEERKHSNWVITFLEDKHVLPIFPAIEKPKVDWEDMKDVLKEAYEHEELVTNFWNKAATECLRCADHDAYQFCCFILKEQREELELFGGLISLYNLSEGKSQLGFDKLIIHP